MPLDYGIYFSKQFAMVILQNKTIVSFENQLKIIINKPIDNISKISEILKNPKLIFKDKNEILKEKLKLYVKIYNKDYKVRLTCNNNPLIRYINDLLNINPQAWRRLYFTDSNLFNELIELWKINKKDLNKMCLYTQSYKEEMVKVNKEIEKISKNYQQMLNQIFDDNNLKYCEIDNIFYPEVRLVNSYIKNRCESNKCESNKCESNKCEFRDGFYSVNERGIMFYIKEKLNYRMM